MLFWDQCFHTSPSLTHTTSVVHDLLFVDWGAPSQYSLTNKISMGLLAPTASPTPSGSNPLLHQLTEFSNFQISLHHESPKVITHAFNQVSSEWPALIPLITFDIIVWFHCCTSEVHSSVSPSIIPLQDLPTLVTSVILLQVWEHPSHPSYITCVVCLRTESSSLITPNTPFQVI